MRALKVTLAFGLLVTLAGCDGAIFGRADADCGSDDALKAIDTLFKEELEFALQESLADQKELGSYDAAELEDAVKGASLKLEDVRTSRDDPDSSRLSCKAILVLDLPDDVEKEANDVRIMAELGTVREAANRFRLKRRGGTYSGDFSYFVQPTDDGNKLYAEIDDDAVQLQFLTEIIGSYLLSDEIREVKIAQDQALAEERRAEREAREAYEAEGAAALNTAQIERKLASESINAVWNSMPIAAQKSIEDVHSAWVQQMKALCSAESAGTDDRATMRKAEELSCQTRFVRSCANILRGNISRRSDDWAYCRIRS